MASVALRSHELALLQTSGLVDESVDLAKVGLHVGGPIAWYLRVVDKSALTLGRHIWFVSERKRDNLPLVIHELVHVAQYQERGVLKFLARYLWDLAKARFRYSRRLPLEAPAYERQALARKVLYPDV